jgi:pimeloyl-ACP methyl ester carboxylesterase
MTMRTIVDSAHARDRSPVLVALLAATFSEPEDFIREGFPQALRERGLAADLVMAELRASWVADGSIVERIEDAIVEPARARGHERIWLGGISLGALAALGYAARHGAGLEGVALISPYPATRAVLDEVDAAGGLERWNPDIPEGGDLEREAWRWLARRPKGALPVFCYFSTGDRFAQGQRRIAGTLPAGASRELPGEHDWAAWRSLWNAFLEDHGAMLQ